MRARRGRGDDSIRAADGTWRLYGFLRPRIRTRPAPVFTYPSHDPLPVDLPVSLHWLLVKKLEKDVKESNYIVIIKFDVKQDNWNRRRINLHKPFYEMITMRISHECIEISSLVVAKNNAGHVGFETKIISNTFKLINRQKQALVNSLKQGL